MIVNNSYKFILGDIPQVIELPVELKWDFYGRDESIDLYEEEVVNEIIGNGYDFEVLRFTHKEYGQEQTKIQYDFFFYSGNTNDVNTSTPLNWVCSYLPEGFNATEVYYYRPAFTKSFFKLDFYDSPNGTTQTNYFTVILPVQQGSTETASISTALPSVQIKKPSMNLDFVGDSEGFYLYWLRNPQFLDINTFYMTAKFFDARLGVFVKMMNTSQGSLPDKFNFIPEQKFYYKVVLDRQTKTYEIFDVVTNQRIGNGTPIKWYEYVNP
jgi:hypothetical protein